MNQILIKILAPMRLNNFIAVLLVILCTIPTALATSVGELKKNCIQDLQFIRNTIVEHSAPAKNKEDLVAQDWLKDGFAASEKLVEEIEDQDDCYYAIRYFTNGFNEKNIAIRPNFKLPMGKYPGFLTAIKDGKHRVVYKHPGVEYIGEMMVGDELVMVDDMAITKFYNNYIKPFYSPTDSLYSKMAASIYTFIVEDNKFVPYPRKAMFSNGKVEYELELQYTNLNHRAANIAVSYQRPKLSDLKVELLSGGMWIRIPSFYPTQAETIMFRGLLTELKKYGSEEFIIFDLRGNFGGDEELQRAVIRNLYGDNYLQAMGKKHEFNYTWLKLHRLTKPVYNQFRRTHPKAATSQFSREMNKGNEFFREKFNIYDENNHLFNNDHTDKIRAKVVVLTDHFCGGACWMMTRQLKQIPGVRHVGEETDVESIYFNPMKFQTPSDNFDFFVPTQILQDPSSHLGESLKPDAFYNGNDDDSELIDWIINQLD